ncbi:MAG: vacuolar protein sorting-associated family 26 protein [Myxococcaceae bacterium]
MLDTLGLGVGALHLEFAGRVFRPGELIRGTVRLDLTEPVPAKRLVVGLDAKQRVVGISPASGSAGGLSYRRDTVFDFHVDLDGERTYEPGETHRFELMVPENASETSCGLPGGTLGEVAQVISFLSSTKRFPLEWRVFAFLDRPWRFNVKAEAPIQLTQPAEAPAAKKRRAPQAASTPGGKKPRPPASKRPLGRKRR